MNILNLVHVWNTYLEHIEHEWFLMKTTALAKKNLATRMKLLCISPYLPHSFRRKFHKQFLCQK